MAEIAIVGGGPSGAMCGEQLARAGHKVSLFDEHLAWEKPCGGGLTHKAIQCFPFLLDNSYPKKLVQSVELISSQEHRATLEMTHPIVIYSRTVLNGMLLDRAREAGCQVQRSRVMSVDTTTTKPRYCMEGVWREADFLVLAAGARNQLLPETRALQRDELEMTQGYFVPQTADSITIKFLPHFEGYIWSFPRNDHLSVGICGSMSSHTSAELRGHLQTFVEQHDITTEGAKFYSHVLPSPQERTLSQRNVLGKNWALIGDAAAWVDPLTGEGLFYAIRSGELLGRSLAEGCPEKYPAWIKAAFSTELEFAARIVRRFYRGSFLGNAVTTRMVQFMRRSPVFRQLVGDLFSGTQDYSSLKRRLWGQLGFTISEFISSVLSLDRTAEARVTHTGASGD
ncbi:MAG TPA: NAD(P)/FAD-dependent oxidoreductase [Candidatus Acidoferrum sp.]|jgi:flavin-dependent dehydrogenase|nr:NAD(P)/FAD-dependent oxidoreductase [Candidatus Acidoferrum sp.]